MSSWEPLALQVTLNTASHAEHVPEIERHIWTIKERMRCIYNTLPFQRMPDRMVIEMVYASNFWLNSFPPESGISDTLSPRAIITGQTIDFHKHCQLEFGTYVQTHEDHDNSMATRTTGALALRSTGNDQGSYFFFSLTTGRILNRNHWTALPMPAEVITCIHALARRNPPGLHFSNRHHLPFILDMNNNNDDDDDSTFYPDDASDNQTIDGDAIAGLIDESESKSDNDPSDADDSDDSYVDNDQNESDDGNDDDDPEPIIVQNDLNDEDLPDIQNDIDQNEQNIAADVDDQIDNISIASSAGDIDNVTHDPENNQGIDQHAIDTEMDQKMDRSSAVMTFGPESHAIMVIYTRRWKSLHCHNIQSNRV
jgi:hypothetical protein